MGVLQGDAPSGGEWSERFGGATRAWLRQSFTAPTKVQARGWEAIGAGRHALLASPTGSGKTLAAFLWCIDRLLHRSPSAADPVKTRPTGYRVIYVSPLKALAYDIERNLRVPLAGIWAAAQDHGISVDSVAIDVRTGDTPARERLRQKKQPGDILITTPESLFLLLASQARVNLATIDTIIVDEIHVLAGTKRGAHLALSLEWLAELTHVEPQRIGLSATMRPLERVAAYLGGDRAVCVVDASDRPGLDVKVEFVPPPGSDLAPGSEAGRDGERGMWPGLHRRLAELIGQHRTTLVFVNNRRTAERVAQCVNEIVGREVALPHHGSLSHRRRREVEDALVAGRVPAIVATSSLELGIDIGSIDLVALVESPGAVARGLQRIGRAGHGVGQISLGRIFPTHPGDLVECAVVARAMVVGEVEEIRVIPHPLDVLAQHLVAWTLDGEREVAALERVIRRAYNYHHLPKRALLATLDMLSGRYPSDALADLRPRLNWDRHRDVVSARRGARALVVANVGTIPDRGLYGVHLGPDGPKVGELDEEMVYESRVGETFLLGASTWRVIDITHDRVIVEPAPGELGKLPFWHGDGPGRPLELGRKVGAFLGELERLPRAGARAWLTAVYGLDDAAVDALFQYVGEQREVTGELPTDRTIIIERFRDALGDWRVCVLTPFGAQVHAPWAIAVESALAESSGFEVKVLWTDDGFTLQCAGVDEPPMSRLLLPGAEELESRVTAQLGSTALFAACFREAAGRSLLLPRRRPGQRSPLWAQRQRSAKLLGVARQYPSFPIVIEAYRECLSDVFDLPGCREVLGAIGAGDIRVVEVTTRAPSPFARSLAYAYVAEYLYGGDAPPAERRAHALALDHTLLRELLGEQDLRELLDPEAIATLEAELQGRASGYRATHADAVHDLLRRVGELDPSELAERCDGPWRAWLAELSRATRAVEVFVAGRHRWAAAEDLGRLHAAVGLAPLPEVPSELLESIEPQEALDSLVYRHARTHGPFAMAAVARRYGIGEDAVAFAVNRLEAKGVLVTGSFTRGSRDREVCEVEVLRRIRQRSLAVLRRTVAPVEEPAYVQFLLSWQGVGAGARGASALSHALAQLEGLALSLRELEESILPARVVDFHPRMLDERGARGELVWVGCGALGARDARVALYRREQVPQLIDSTGLEHYESPTPLHAAILAHLERRGACFAAELGAATGARLEELGRALLDLAWSGQATNDTLQALRALPLALARPGDRRARALGAALTGRWSLSRELWGWASTTPEQRALVRAQSLLERYGLVTRAAAHAEGITGGFAALYPILRALEDGGKVRRGHFVAGLDGAQFALPAAVDGLRVARPDMTDAIALAAVDPANPYGASLPWPALCEPSAMAPRRAVGARLILVGGVAVAYLDASGRSLATFAGVEPMRRERGWPALLALAGQRRGRMLRIDRIDGVPALASPHAAALKAIGFVADWRGLHCEA